MNNSVKNIKAEKVEKTTIINLEKGKLPPQAIEIEEAILGAMLIDKTGLEEAIVIIPFAECFYLDKHKIIFQSIKNLHEKGDVVDLLTVSSELKSNGNLEKAGGDFYLIQLTQKISSSAHIEFHSRILLQHWMRRKVILFSSQNISLAYDDSVDVFDLLEGWQKAFDGISESVFTGRTTVSFSTALSELKKDIELLTNNKEDVKLVGVDTGFNCINKSTGGYRDQDLIIIAARPGMGKTSYVLNCAISNLRKGVGVGFISLEMSVKKLTARAVAIDTEFHLSQLIKKGFEKKEYFNAYEHHKNRMEKYLFYIDDTGRKDISDIVITAKIWKRKHDIKLLIVDYLQLMGDRSVKGNREVEIASISRRLKMLAKELDIPVIALSQLSRAVETRGSSKRPLLSDLRESGAIEQDADIVNFIYRPGYYNIEMNLEDYDESMHGLINAGADTEIIFAKYRDGSLGTELLKWIGDKTKYIDVSCGIDKVVYGNVEDAF